MKKPKLVQECQSEVASNSVDRPAAAEGDEAVNGHSEINHTPQVFPVLRLPDPALSCVFKYLEVKDKKNLRLVNRRFGNKIKILDSTCRIWKIDLEDYSEFKDVKNTVEEAKIDGLKYRINFGLLKQDLDLCKKKEMLTWIINDWGIHVTGLRLNLNGSKDFLLEEFFKFPHLEMLPLGEDPKAFRRIRRSRNLVIEKELIARHANSLTKLSVGYEGRLPLRINLPHIEEVKFRLLGDSIKSLLWACRKSVKRIEFDGCQ